MYLVASPDWLCGFSFRKSTKLYGLVCKEAQLLSKILMPTSASVQERAQEFLKVYSRRSAFRSHYTWATSGQEVAGRLAFDRLVCMFYLQAPAKGVTWTVQDPWPDSCRGEVRANPALAPIVDFLEGVWDGRAAPNQLEFCRREILDFPRAHLGTIKYAEYNDYYDRQGTDKWVLENAVKAGLAICLEWLIWEYIPELLDLAEADLDVMQLLQDPMILSPDRTVTLETWFIASLRNCLIVPTFGSLTQFYDALIKTRWDGRGYLLKLRCLDPFDANLTLPKLIEKLDNPRLSKIAKVIGDIGAASDFELYEVYLEALNHVRWFRPYDPLFRSPEEHQRLVDAVIAETELLPIASHYDDNLRVDDWINDDSTYDDSDLDDYDFDESDYEDYDDYDDYGGDGDDDAYEVIE